MITTFEDSPVFLSPEQRVLNVTTVSTLAHGILGNVYELLDGYLAIGMDDQVSHVYPTEELAINWLFVLWTNKKPGLTPDDMVR